MRKEDADRKKRKRNRRLIIIAVTALILLFVASMMHIGAGRAEWAGLTVSDLTSNLAMEFNIPADEEGVVVNWIEGSAYYSGVKEGDLLKAINNKKVRTVSEFLKVARGINLDDGALLDILRGREPLFITLKNRPGLHAKIKKALGIPSGATGMSDAGVHSAGSSMTPVALSAAIPMAGGRLPTPKEQGASKRIVVEAHWLGMELISLTPELAKEYRIPPGTKGVLVDEISLEAAESGILAGDMVLAVEGISTPDLVTFTEATRRVKNRKKAQILVSRRGQLLQFTMMSDRMLGFSQNEAAQPILPGAISPHRSRNKPCTACHIIMRTGGQLPTDAGDILPNPPPITKGAVAPHRYRGACKNCHVILKK